MSALRRVLAAVAVAATACVPVPAFEPESGVTHVATEDGITISAPASTTAPGLTLQTSSASKFTFPSRLLIGAIDVLGHNLNAECNIQDEIGILLQPMQRVSAHGEAPLGRAYMDRTMMGPAVAQYHAFWESGFCSTSRAPYGASTFTVFPDGRIVRYDEVIDEVAEPLAVSTCNCSSTDYTFRAQSFWTFKTNTSPAPTLERHPLPTPIDSEVGNPDYDCLNYGDVQIAIGWPSPATSIMRATGETVAFNDELSRRVGENAIGAFNFKSTSVLVPSSTGCTSAMDRVLAIIQPAQYTFRINNDEQFVAPQNGIYASDVPNGGGYRLEATTKATLTGTAPAFFAVWLTFAGPVEALRVTKQGGDSTGAWYIPQKASGGWIVWFRDPLLASETITIEPR